MSEKFTLALDHQSDRPASWRYRWPPEAETEAPALRARVDRRVRAPDSTSYKDIKDSIMDDLMILDHDMSWTAVTRSRTAPSARYMTSPGVIEAHSSGRPTDIRRAVPAPFSPHMN
ncbi:MAG: hypothetical protein ACR2LK_00330, partial [Solirubrobacteraceae bacterium]